MAKEESRHAMAVEKIADQHYLSEIRDQLVAGQDDIAPEDVRAAFALSLPQLVDDEQAMEEVNDLVNERLENGHLNTWPTYRKIGLEVADAYGYLGDDGRGAPLSEEQIEQQRRSETITQMADERGQGDGWLEGRRISDKNMEEE